MIFKQKLIARACLLAGGLLAASAPTYAHHAFAAEFDANKPVELTGKLTKIEWINPHGWIYLDVTDKSGKVTNWAIEFGGPNALMRRGLRKTDFPIGAEVYVNGYLAKSGKPIANGSTVKLPDGRDFFAGSENTGLRNLLSQQAIKERRYKIKQWLYEKNQRRYYENNQP